MSLSDEFLNKNRTQVTRRSIAARRLLFSALLVSTLTIFVTTLALFSVRPRTISPYLLNLPSLGFEKDVLSSPGDDSRPLTVYLDVTHFTDNQQRSAHTRDLQKVTFPNYTCQSPFPVDNFPTEDPYLPWIHDYFVDEDRQRVVFVAQNRRRCHTGAGMEDIMTHMEPQTSLFQPIMVRQEPDGRVRLATSWEEATHNETRFLCHFHTDHSSSTTMLSTFPFNYEYIYFRKHSKATMAAPPGAKDVSNFELSTLIFYCPFPKQFGLNDPSLRVDIIPIRTPTRMGEFLFSATHVGQQNLDRITLFNASTECAHASYLPPILESGRIANIPLCRRNYETRKKYHLVLCSWQAAAYHRRGDATVVDDAGDRLREWIIFHRMVGVDRIYLYDNTHYASQSLLATIASEFPDFVSYQAWPARVCSNNRPQNPNPGERSSQYAAEASCREQYGPTTKWMAFLDVDEYLVPAKTLSWKHVLDEKASQGFKVLKLRSSRGRPRLQLLRSDGSGRCDVPDAARRKGSDDCLVPRRNESFLHVYNCDFIKPPRPDRFQRAMKQIYQPSFVLSHFVHYAAVTKSIAQYFADSPAPARYKMAISSSDFSDIFLDELEEGILIHSKTVLPEETTNRNETCRVGSRKVCPVGYPCPQSTPFDDKRHNENLFTDRDGNFCNCWPHQHLEQALIPRLHKALQEHHHR